MNFILKNWVKYCTKEVFKTLKIVLLGFVIISAIVGIKYKPVYAVTLSGETIGYVANKEKTEKKINNYIDDKNGNIAFRVATALPEYNLKLVNRNIETNETTIILAVEEKIITTYETYAITVNGEVKAEVTTETEAEEIVKELEENLEKEVEMNLGISTIYSNTLVATTKAEALETLNEVKTEKVSAYEEKQAKEKAEYLKTIKSSTQVASNSTVAGMQLSIPVSGSVTSRFGSRSSSRSTVHTGVDISAPTGTGITAISSGTVIYADYKGSYGNLLIIEHGNGVQSYYAHCNQLYVGVGANVDSNTTIATVGSTGNSTGPHLHLEIRVNGTPINPQQYLYK